MQQSGSRGGIFLAGIFFMVWVAYVCVEPRMPSDDNSKCSIGGRLSAPFRQAMLGLVGLATLRFLLNGTIHPNNALGDAAQANSTAIIILDGILVTIFNVGLSFLCMTTSYILECQLTRLINIKPGSRHIPFLLGVLGLTVCGIILSHTSSPNFSALISLAGAFSSIPIIQTLKLYAKLTTHGGNHEGRGNVLTQILLATEYYYVFSCLVAFLAEAFHRGVEVEERLWTDDLIDSMRHHQDIGVDDSTRLLVHSIFLNLIDELTHMSSAESSSNSTTASSSDTWSESGDIPARDPESNALVRKKAIV